MKTVKHVVTEIGKVQFGFWMQYSEDEGEFHALESAADYEMASKYLGCSAELLDTLAVLHSNLVEAIGADLTDIWQRLDR